MWTCVGWQSCAVIVCCGLLGGVFAVGNQKSPVYPRSIKSSPRDPGGGGGSELGNPAEWTMSKANLVAEFYSHEPAAPPSAERGRSQKSIFSFLSNNPNSNFNSNNISKNFPPRHRPPHPQQQQQQPHPTKGYSKQQHFNGNANLMASGSNPVPFEINRNGNFNNGNGGSGGGAYASPFRPIKFPQQNFIFPSASVRNNNINNNDNNGYLPPLPPRGPSPPQSQPPLPSPSSQLYWESNKNQIKGLVPPPMVAPLQNQNQPAPPPPHTPAQSLYLPPPTHQPPPPPRVNQNQPPPSRDQIYQPPSKFTPPQYQAPPPHPQNSTTSTSVNSFHPSPQYLPQQTQPQPQPAPHFKPAPPAPPQILDTYRNQAVYPAAPGPSHYQQPPQTQRPMIYVMANTSSNSPRNKALLPPLFNFNHQLSPADPYTNYEIEPNSIPQFPPAPPPPQSAYTSTSTSTSTESHFHPQLSSSSLALTEPLSQVLAEANAKAGADMDKTIRFVIHKPEDEDVVKNAILEDAQNRYEDVRFVQGPTLKVQRKETVYLPPKKKTVVYILLKEPQIDTDVQVMSPQEDEPAPEVYITYQKSDGAVKTKHYSPKPIAQDEMKKYLDIEVESDSYGSSGEESRVQPRFSKSTSVSLSTSTHTLKKSVSVELNNDTNYNDNYNNSALMANHRLTPLVVDNNRIASTPTATPPTLPTTLTPLKMSPLLFATSSNSNSTYFLPYRSASKKGPRAVPSSPSSSYRRFLRNPLIQCPTTVT